MTIIVVTSVSHKSSTSRKGFENLLFFKCLGKDVIGY